MARFTKRQLVTAFSVVYLALLTILATYALHRANFYSLPIPSLLAALTVALPPLAGITLESAVTFQYQLAAKGNLQASRTFQLLNAFFLVYETVLATLAGTHIAPATGLWCPLHDTWQAMFKIKDGERIRRIQDAFNCCGFNGLKDMSFPFQDKNHEHDTCMVRYERTSFCVEPWRTAERRVAIIMLAVPLAVFVWKVALFMAPGFETPWLPSALRLPNDNANGGTGRPREAIEYRDIEESGGDDSLYNETSRLNQDSRLASHVESGRVRPSPLIQEQENWRD